ncbi:MAG: imidazoleglycerol-phosphate dehydratase HisB, partial [Firmicutes bacterium]|nr:imidazoleglycerol-phosphate dehydratase HisB [Bacillota bacterium]
MRKAEINRKTGETDISAKIVLSGSGKRKIETGIGFFDHMLDLFAKHGFFDLELLAKGDLHVDAHHTVEDVGLVLGDCIKEALGDKSGIKRYGSAIIPMDETLVLCAVDLSGRPYLSYDLKFRSEKIGEMDTELFEEFFCALSSRGAFNLHIKLISGGNSHHVAEAAFKALGRA